MKRIDIWTVVGFPVLLFLVCGYFVLSGALSPTGTATASSAQYSDSQTAQYAEPTYVSPIEDGVQGRAECSLTFDGRLTLTGTVLCVR